MIDKQLQILHPREIIKNLISVDNSDKSSFKFGNESYGLFKGSEDNNYLVKCWSEKKTYRLSDFLTKKVGINKEAIYDYLSNREYSPIIEPIKQQIDKDIIKNTLIKSSISIDRIDKEYLNKKLTHRFQIKEFNKEYIELIGNGIFISNRYSLKRDINRHRTVKKFKVDTLYHKKIKNDCRAILKHLNIEPIISNINQDIELPNIRFKTGKSKWITLKGLNNSGFYFNKEDSKYTTLIVVEGGKDGINSHIALNYDVFAIDSKTSLNTSKLLELIPKYKHIYFCLDRDADIKEIYETLFNDDKEKRLIDKQHIDKCLYLDWSLLDYIEKPKADISDLIEWLLNNGTKKSEFKHSGKHKLFKVIKANSKKFVDIELEKNIKRYKSLFEYYKLTSKIDKINKLYISINGYMDKYKRVELKELLDNISIYLMEIKQFKKSHKITVNSYLSERKNEIIEHITKHKNTLIYAPTGTGKSTLIRDIAKQYKLLILTPIKALTNEFKNENIDLIENQKKEYLEADWNGCIFQKKSVCMTTDRFAINFDIFKNDINEFDFIVFDEQHLINQSFGFRYSVIDCYKKLKKLSNNIVFLSATPENFDNFTNELEVIEVQKLNKYNLHYTTTNKSLNTLLNEKIKAIEIGESILIYCDTKNKVKELYRYLRAGITLDEKINDIELIERDNLLPIYITSNRDYYHNQDNKIIRVDNLNEIPKDKKVIYIATTKINTGVNLTGLKHIVCYGGCYTPNDIIQLFSRLRVSGTITRYNINRASNYKENQKDLTIGLFNALLKELDQFKTNSLKDLIDKYPQGAMNLKHKSDLKEFTLKEFYREFKQQITLLNYYGLITIKHKKIDDSFKIDDIEIVSDNYKMILETIKDILINKQIDELLAQKFLNGGLDTLFQLKNTSQNIIIESDEDTSSKKFMTIENREEIKQKIEESKSERDSIFERYFEHFNFNDYERENTIKLFGKVGLRDLEKFINKAIEDKDDYIRKQKWIRTQKDVVVFINVKLGLFTEIKEILKELEDSGIFIITAKKLIEIYTQKGLKLKAINGNANPFKAPIDRILQDNDFTYKTNWIYQKNQVTINGKQYRNFIIHTQQKEFNQIVKTINDNNIDFISFCSAMDKNINQLYKLQNGKNGGLENLILEYQNIPF